MAIHHHLAGHHAQVACFAGAEKCLDRFGMDGAVHHRGCGAAAQQFIEKKFRYFTRMHRIGKLSLGRKRVRLQPRQQARCRRGNHVGLRIVNVRVDEPGNDQFAAIVGYVYMLRQGCLQRRVIAGRADVRAINDEQSVFMEDMGVVAKSRVGREMQDAGAIGVQGRYGVGSGVQTDSQT